MDREGPSGLNPEAGISIRMGPIQETINGTNGVSNGKRKSRGSLSNGKSYKEASGSGESESDQPLVRHSPSTPLYLSTCR
jgi:DNA topoisomerase-1